MQLKAKMKLYYLKENDWNWSTYVQQNNSTKSDLYVLTYEI